MRTPCGFRALSALTVEFSLQVQAQAQVQAQVPKKGRACSAMLACRMAKYSRSTSTTLVQLRQLYDFSLPYSEMGVSVCTTVYLFILIP